MPKPLCFVLMPFGKKTDATGDTVDFDLVYREIIVPAIETSGMEPLRADEEMTGGIIHKPMFERLILCEFAVADLTTANANVFYELGLRHAVRRWSTVLIFADGDRLPFDVASLRALPYKLGPGGVPQHPDVDARALAAKLAESRRITYDSDTPATDSPLYELVQDYPDVDHSKTDVFRDRVRYSNEVKTLLAKARGAGLDSVRSVEAELGNLNDLESAAVVDLLLSFRATGGFTEMVELVERMPKPLAVTVLVQEQFAFALNRIGRSDDAEHVLTSLVERRGPSSETLGLLGRVYKDRWDAAVKEGDEALAKSYLASAISTYLNGFEADWRDAYPGVNAVTLMELANPPDPRREQLLPVVEYAAQQGIRKGVADYWDYATLMEIAILRKDPAAAFELVGDCRAKVRESWELETTLKNVAFIRRAREQRNEDVSWILRVEDELAKSLRKNS
jgi:hypothetical protein